MPRSDGYEIEVELTTASGGPVAGATIWLAVPDEPALRVMTTGEDGLATFSGLPHSVIDEVRVRAERVTKVVASE